jgi:hypothetical protein
MDSRIFKIPSSQDESVWQRKIPWPIFLGTVLLLSFFTIWLVGKSSAGIGGIRPVLVSVKRVKKEEPLPPPKKVFVPGPFSMETIKKKGCVGDGMLSGYGDNKKEMIALIKRSNCRYIHRALETWMDPPDFEKSGEIMAEFDQPGIVFGMFIAEAIDKSERYKDEVTGEKFDFSKMCRSDSENTWGFHSCQPSFEKPEYKKYIEYATEKAMDIGIQSFLFGQIFYQNQQPLSDSELPNVIRNMRRYAKKKGLQIVIGAQTNAITDEKYLKLFDYIEGGVGIDSQGNIEDGPCWSQKSSCWALLWNDQFRSRAKNVLLHLDWSGIKNDDMSTFALMDQETRKKTLDNLYTYFTTRNMGFLMPFLAPLYKDNGGCYGPKKRFYSPDNRYKCRDEDAINAILSRG